MECCSVLTVPSHPGFDYCTSLVVHESPGIGALWQLAAIELVLMALVRLVHAAQQGVTGLQYYDSQMGQGGCRVLAFAVASVNAALCHSWLIALLIGSILIGCIIAQEKSIGRLLMGCTIGFHTALRSGVYTT